MFANDLKHSFANFLAVYKNNGEKYTGKQGDRIDPIFLKGLISLSSEPTIISIINGIKKLLINN